MAEQPKPGSIVHVEIPSKDPARAKKFYGEVFGWKTTDVPEMNYTLFEAPSGPGGGIRTPWSPTEDRPLNYILVNSVDEAIRKITHAGGKILPVRLPDGKTMEGKQEVPGQGWFALFQDPTGAVNAVWENNPEAMRQWEERQRQQGKA